MVDMHIHTLYSDGDKTLEEVLKKCEEKHLDYISITDHNCCKAYYDKCLKSNIYTGKICCGAELKATLDDGKSIDILAYNIKNLEVINEWNNRFYSNEILESKFNKAKNKMIDICNSNHLIYDNEIINKKIPITDYFTSHMYNELIKHKENLEVIGEGAKSFKDFIVECLDNPQSIFYMGEDDSEKPMFREVVDVIHKAGGLVFLAHPFEYKYKDTLGFIDCLRKKIKLDGIECFHPSAESENRIELLLNYARENNLFISGGSDFHGDKNPNNNIGSLNISTEYIEEWVETIN